ncbi:MAG: hypothetical protein MCSN_0860 [Candidatus Microsyncoccus archaeolyticus]|nr:MAG: hypothetical protein MCSN_0860 [Candidatus Parcubacteria bacterium]
MNKSFTLIEILVVIVVIGILSSFILVGMSSITNNANIAKGKAFVDSADNNLLLSRLSYLKLDGNGNDSWGNNNFNINGVTESTSCVFGSCYFFDGTTSDYIIKNPINDFPTSQISISLWLNSSDTTKEGTLISYATGHSDNEFLIYIYVSSISVYPNFRSTGLVFNDGKWHNMFFTWTNTDGSVRIYKDGVLVYSNSLSAGTVLASPGSLVIGQEQDNVGGGFSEVQSFLGTIDEIKIYNSVLSISANQEDYYVGLNSLLLKNEIDNQEYVLRTAQLKNIITSVD